MLHVGACEWGVIESHFVEGENDYVSFFVTVNAVIDSANAVACIRYATAAESVILD
jgi:hypothetical protein